MVKKFLHSFYYAFQGIKSAFDERNFKIQFIIGIIVIVFGYFLNLSHTEWLIIIICSFLVLSLEMINTAIEKLSDSVTKEINPLIKEAKDIAAGAVLLFSIASAIIGLVIFIPKIFALFKI